jgi:hypothetical protein
MKCCIEGEDRSKNTPLPENLDDYIDEDNLVRVIDVFVAEPDLTAPRFDHSKKTATVCFELRKSLGCVKSTHCGHTQHPEAVIQYSNCRR